MLVPPGRYLCFSIRLKSRVTLQLAAGAVIEAADPGRHAGAYDLPEDGAEQLYQDFRHSHWRNSLIWGDDVHDVAIIGPGLIHGVGLTRNGPGARWKAQTGERPHQARYREQRRLSQHPDRGLHLHPLPRPRTGDRRRRRHGIGRRAPSGHARCHHSAPLPSPGRPPPWANRHGRRRDPRRDDQRCRRERDRPPLPGDDRRAARAPDRGRDPARHPPRLCGRRHRRRRRASPGVLAVDRNRPVSVRLLQQPGVAPSKDE